MSKEDIERQVDKAISKRIRIAAQNSRGQFSSCWIFWGHKNDFYFGAKSISAAIKVSLHANGRGYVGYDKSYFERKRAEGIVIPAKTAREWKLPIPGPLGAAHAASLVLPADYCRSTGPSESGRKKTFILGIEEGCCAEIGIFLSRESPNTLEAKLTKIGMPMFAIALDNNSHVSLVARSRQFEPLVLPSEAQTAAAAFTKLRNAAISKSESLNAVIWDAPNDAAQYRSSMLAD